MKTETLSKKHCLRLARKTLVQKLVDDHYRAIELDETFNRQVRIQQAHEQRNRSEAAPVVPKPSNYERSCAKTADYIKANRALTNDGASASSAVVQPSAPPYPAVSASAYYYSCSNKHVWHDDCLKRDNAFSNCPVCRNKDFSRITMQEARALNKG